jgi:glutamate synthase domain-containing protein 3
VGAKVAGEIARRYGDQGLPEETLELRFSGSAGQSFGAFCIAGLKLILEGEANDYVGKGMAGGQIILRPPATMRLPPHEQIIMGNTVLYGATGGELFASGRAGERFAVRNSGAVAVVEGVGDHGCEYMTGGVVVVLGPVGKNFAAGMTGGVAYVFDEHAEFDERCNRGLVDVGMITEKDELALRPIIEKHLTLTGSPHARLILQTWGETRSLFRKVAPRSAKAIETTYHSRLPEAPRSSKEGVRARAAG